MPPKPSKDLATMPNIGNYLAMQSDPERIGEIIQANLGGRQLTPFDLDRAKVPTGGGTSWEVPDLSGESHSVKSLSGIILHWQKPRGYWSQGLDAGGKSPPDCSSGDGVTGQGDPGGDCATCRLNVWGSGKNGGKACQEKRLLFLLQPDSMLPMVVQVPTMSIKTVEQYFLRLASKAIPYWAVVTNLNIKKTAQRKGGIEYGQISPTLAQELSSEESEHIHRLVESFAPVLATTGRQIAQEEEEGLG